MGRMTLAALPGRTDELTLHPDWGMQRADGLPSARHRTRDGALHTVRWGAPYRRFTLPLADLAEADAEQIATWWRAGQRLALVLDADDLTSLHVVRLTNARRPLFQRVRPDADRWRGTLALASTTGGRRHGSPFLLDDAVYGKLGQPYNPLR